MLAELASSMATCNVTLPKLHPAAIRDMINAITITGTCSKNIQSNIAPKTINRFPVKMGLLTPDLSIQRPINGAVMIPIPDTKKHQQTAISLHLNADHLENNSAIQKINYNK